MSDFPARLPAGWVALAPVGDVQVAVLPAGDDAHAAAVLTVTPGRDGDHADRHLASPPAGSLSLALSRVLDRLRAAVDLLVIDEGPVRCRRDTPAHRMLTAHAHDGRGITTEVWLVAGACPAVLCAAMDTARYAELGPVVQRVLRSYRPCA